MKERGKEKLNCVDCHRQHLQHSITFVRIYYCTFNNWKQAITKPLLPSLSLKRSGKSTCNKQQQQQQRAEAEVPVVSPSAPTTAITTNSYFKCARNQNKILWYLQQIKKNIHTYIYMYMYIKTCSLSPWFHKDICFFTSPLPLKIIKKKKRNQFSIHGSTFKYSSLSNPNSRSNSFRTIMTPGPEAFHEWAIGCLVSKPEETNSAYVLLVCFR